MTTARWCTKPERPVGARQDVLAVGHRHCRRFVLSGTAHLPASTEFIVPFFKNVVYPFGAIGFCVLTYFVIVGTSNAVSLTDGLDGLAALPVVLVSAALAVFAYVAGHAVFAKYLGLLHIPGRTKWWCSARPCAAPVWRFCGFNAYPAQVFMGDVGALALGAALGTVAVIVRQEIVLFIMGGVFVMEALSVMIQVAASSSPASGCFAWRRCITTMN